MRTPDPVGRTGAEGAPPSWLLYWLLVVPLAAAAVVDLPRLRRVGPMTGLGALTVGEAALAACVLLACGRYSRQLLVQLAPFVLFLGWIVATMSWAPPELQGAQNLAAYALFGLTVASGGALASRSPLRTRSAISWGIRIIDVGGIALVIASLVRDNWAPSEDYSRWLVQPRAVSITGLIALAWHLSSWRAGRRTEAALAVLWVVAIFATLSRTATATAVLMLIATVALWHSTPLARRHRLLLAGVTVLGFLAAMYVVGPFRRRFLIEASETSSAGIAGTGQVLKKSDRTLFWRHVSNSALEAPIVGKGMGSSQAVMEERWPGVGHPHNDYLRIWHDFGAIGFFAFAAAVVGWLRVLVRGARGDRVDGVSQLAFAGLLALIGLLLPMITDNAIVYPFVVGPAGLLIGAGLGAGGATARIPRGVRAESGPTGAALSDTLLEKYKPRRRRHRS